MFTKKKVFYNMNSFWINKTSIFDNLQITDHFKLPYVNTLIMPTPPSARLVCYDTATNSILFSTEEFKWKVLKEVPVV